MLVVLFMKRRPVADSPLTAGCILLSLAVAGTIASVILGISREGLMCFVMAVIAVPSVPIVMRQSSVKPRAGAGNLVIEVLACTLQNIALMLPVWLVYSLMVHMSLLSATGFAMTGRSAVFYLSTGFICLCLVAGASWLKYNAAVSVAASMIGSALSSGLIALGLTLADWRMGLAVLWVMPFSFGMLWLCMKRKYLYVPYLVPLLGLVSAALTGAALYSAETLSGAKFLMYLLAASRMYDPLESAIRTVHEQEAK